jgi:hypothetical protein
MENYQSLYNYVLSMPSIQKAIQNDWILLISLAGSRSIEVQHEKSDYDITIVFKNSEFKNKTLAPWGEFEGVKISFLKSSYDDIDTRGKFINWNIISLLIPQFSPYEPIYKHPDYDSFDFKLLHETALRQTFETMSSRFFDSSPAAVNRFKNEKIVYWLLALHFTKMKEMGAKELGIISEYRKMSTDVKENQEILTEGLILDILSDIKNRKIYYDSLTVAELKSLASDRELTNYSSMVKADLIELHREYDEQNSTQQEVNA